jgi:hypothetical protein
MVRNREPEAIDVIGFTDGLTILCECSDDPDVQNAYFNGYYHDTCCNNVFCFSPEGKIIYASINCPGSWHDSQVAANLIQKVINEIGQYKICVDQGFPRGGELMDKFVGPISKKRRKRLLREQLLRQSNVYASLRQASEWGMRSLQGSFPRLKSRLCSDKEKRKDIILSIILLHNFRTTHVGLNQIATVFNYHYEQFINIDGYDRIARYYANVNDIND